MTTSTNGARRFLGPPVTARYKPSLFGGSWNLWQSGQRGFWLQDVELMRRDPQILFGSAILSAPIQHLKWKIESQDARVVPYVDDILKRFWRKDLHAVLKCIAWGFMGGEPLWRLGRSNQGQQQIQYDRLKDVHPLDCRPMETAGMLTGLRILNGSQGSDRQENDLETPILRQPRMFWMALDPEYGSFYGVSRYRGAWIPWMEQTGRHGGKDSRRLWMLKNAFWGGTIRHPPGYQELPNGTRQSNEDYAREILEKMENGAILILPNAKDPDTGDFLWSYEAPTVHGNAGDILQYPKDLNYEMLTGMEIPPEVVQAATVGSGFSGRSVPFLVYLSREDQVAFSILDAVDRFICKPGVWVNFGAVDYQITPISLTELAKEEEERQQPRRWLPHEEGAERREMPGGPPERKPPNPEPSPNPIQLSISDDIRRKVRRQARKLFPPRALATCHRCGTVLSSNGSETWCPRCSGIRLGFNESEHPRGQPENAGQFAKGSGSHKKKSEDHGIAFFKGTSPGTSDAINNVMTEIKSNGFVPPRLVLAGDATNIPGPGEARGVMLRINPELAKNLPASDLEMQRKWGKKLVIDSSLEGIVRHELTHLKIDQMSAPEKEALYASVKPFLADAGKLLSARAEANADEFLAEAGNAYLGGKLLAPHVEAIAAKIWGPRNQPRGQPDKEA